MHLPITLDTLVEILLAIGLSAASGFRVFVPLLILSTASVVGHIDLPTNFDWIESPQALALFAIACALEIIGYSIPWADHLLDIVATPAAILAGTLVAFASIPEMHPVTQWAIALIAGGGTAGLTKSLLNLLRGTSTAATGGLANPLFALLELIAATGLSILALTVPAIAGLLVLGTLGFALTKLITTLTAWLNRKPANPPTP